MDEELLHGLRWVLLCDEAGWRAELDRVLAPHRGQPVVIEGARQLLAAKLPDADPGYRPRMKAMIEAMVPRSGPADDDAAWRDLAREWLAVDGRVERLERELAAAQRELADVAARVRAHLAPGASRAAGEVRFERRPDREVITVVDADRVPRELCRIRPDPELMVRAYRTTGQAPPGTMAVWEPGEVDAMRVSSG